MWNVFIFRNSPALRDMFTSNIHSFCVTWWQLHFSDSHFLTQILWCFTLVQTKKCVFKLILSEVRCLYVWDRIFNKFCTLNALFIGIYYDCLSPFFVLVALSKSCNVSFGSLLSNMIKFRAIWAVLLKPELIYPWTNWPY